MINNYLKELVKVPQHNTTKDDMTLTMFGECTAWFHGVCFFEEGDQVAPCINCPNKDKIKIIER